MLGLGAVVVVDLQPFAGSRRRFGNLHCLAAVAVGDVVIAVGSIGDDKLLVAAAVVVVEAHLGLVVGACVEHFEASARAGACADFVDSVAEIGQNP